MAEKSTTTKTTKKPSRAAATNGEAPKPRRRTTKKTAAPTAEQIAERAYYISLEQPGGGAMDHWLQAERELSAPAVKQSSAS
jgi:hypothetical protein